MTARDKRIPLQDRLLAELVRQREEGTGHPQDCPEADAAARAGGGDLAARIVRRARNLPDSAALRAQLHSALAVGGLASLGVVALFGLAGVAVARTALQGGDPVSLPLALALTVGPNLALLGIWLLWLVAARGAVPGLPALLRMLALRLPVSRGAGQTGITTLRPLLLGPAGRWIGASLMHLAWSAYSIAALLSLLVLLSLRSYALSWETTLLDDAALRAWAEALSLAPQLLGLAGADELPLRTPMPEAAREAWAAWLLAAVAAYGLLPRLLALLSCLIAARHSLLRSTLALHEPGFARLRARLMPEHGATRVEMPAPSMTATATSPSVTPAALPTGPLHALAVESDCLPATLPPDWIWMGRVDDADSRRAALTQLQSEAVQGLALIVRAAGTADRGSRHLLQQLLEGADAPGVLIMAGAAPEPRLRDWRALAAELGLATHHWQGQTPLRLTAGEAAS